MLYLCAATVGVMSYYMSDRKYRMAFLEARRSLEVKLTLEEQSTQQVTPTCAKIPQYTFLNENTCFIRHESEHAHTHTNMYSLISLCFAHRMIKQAVVVPREALYLRDNQNFVLCELSFLFCLT